MKILKMCEENHDCSSSFPCAPLPSSRWSCGNIDVRSVQKSCASNHGCGKFPYAPTRRRKRSERNFDQPSDNHKTQCVIENDRLTEHPQQAPTADEAAVQTRLTPASASSRSAPRINLCKAAEIPFAGIRLSRSPFASRLTGYPAVGAQYHRKQRTASAACKTDAKTVSTVTFFKLLLFAMGAMSHVMTGTAASVSAPATSTSSPPTTRLIAHYDVFPPPENNVLRVERSVLTPPARMRRTSPQNVPPDFLTQYDKPQWLVTRHGLTVEIRKNGKVKATRKRKSCLNQLQISSGGSAGVVVIYSNITKRYLSMDKKGRLVGQKTATASSKFREEILENGRFVFYQQKRFRKRRRQFVRNIYISFDSRGRPKRGKKIQRNSAMAQFTVTSHPSAGMKNKKCFRKKAKGKRPGRKRKPKRRRRPTRRRH